MRSRDGDETVNWQTAFVALRAEATSDLRTLAPVLLLAVALSFCERRATDFTSINKSSKPKARKPKSEPGPRPFFAIGVPVISCVAMPLFQTGTRPLISPHDSGLRGTGCSPVISKDMGRMPMPLKLP